MSLMVRRGVSKSVANRYNVPTCALRLRQDSFSLWRVVGIGGHERTRINNCRQRPLCISISISSHSSFMISSHGPMAIVMRQPKPDVRSSCDKRRSSRVKMCLKRYTILARNGFMKEFLAW